MTVEMQIIDTIAGDGTETNPYRSNFTTKYSDFYIVDITGLPDAGAADPNSNIYHVITTDEIGAQVEADPDIYILWSIQR